MPGRGGQALPTGETMGAGQAGVVRPEQVECAATAQQLVPEPPGGKGGTPGRSDRTALLSGHGCPFWFADYGCDGDDDDGY